MMFQHVFLQTRRILGESNNKRIFLLSGIILFFISVLLLHPLLRGIVITFTKNYILHRGINVSLWIERLKLISCLGIIASIVCLCFFSIKASVFLPPAFGFILTTLFCLNTIVYDDWSAIIGFLDNVSKNGLSFSNLFAQDNDSRYLFPKLVWLLLGKLFHVNMKIYMYFDWLLITISYLLVIFYVSHENKSEKNGKQKLFLYLLLGVIFFNVLQWDVDALLESASVSWFLKQLFIVVGFLCFHYSCNSGKTKYLICSGLSFVIASYSHLSGAFWLPVILIVFIFLLWSKTKIQKKMMLFSLVLCIIIYPLYFYGWHKMDIHTDYHYAQFKDIIYYFFTTLGSPLLPRHFSQNAAVLRAMIAGISLFIIAMILVVCLIKHRKVAANIFPICLIFYGFAFCASVAMGRVGFGVEQSLSTRYIVNILPTIIGIVLIIYREILTSKSCSLIEKNIFKYGLFALFFLCFSINTDWSIPRNAYNQRKDMQKILIDYKNQPLGYLQTFYPWWNNLETARATIEIAENHGWSVFYKNKARRPLKFTMLTPVPLYAPSTNDIAETQMADGNIILQCGIEDPFVVFSLQEPLDLPTDEPYIELKYTSNTSGVLQVFYDYGNDFSEQNSSIISASAATEKSTIYLPIKGWLKENKLMKIRIDPPGGANFEIQKISIVEADLTTTG